MKKILFLSALGVLGMLCGCSSPTGRFHSRMPGWQTNFTTVPLTNAMTAELARPSSAFFTLGPGDRLEIEIIGQQDTLETTFVGPDGKIYYFLLPGLDVWGRTLAQTSALLERELEQYFSQAQVAITLREVGSKQVWLLGRLNKPGVYPLAGATTLLEAIALAGGTAQSSSAVTTAELADLRHSFVMRQGQLLPVDFHRLLREGDTTQNIYLQPDDFVYVPSALSQQVYVLGSVRTPHAVPYSEGMTLAGALTAVAGAAKIEWLAPGNYGMAPDAYLRQVSIVRGSLTQPRVAIVDANAIIKGRAPDVPLEPGDIVFVPNAPYSTLKRYLNLVVNTFISTVAANEGIRAGGGETIGVSVPVGP